MGVVVEDLGTLMEAHHMGEVVQVALGVRDILLAVQELLFDKTSCKYYFVRLFCCCCVSQDHHSETGRRAHHSVPASWVVSGLVGIQS